MSQQLYKSFELSVLKHCEYYMKFEFLLWKNSAKQGLFAKYFSKALNSNISN